MNIPDTAFDAADKACQQYGDHQGMVLDDESALSMDQLDLIADAIKAAAPFIAAQALHDEADYLDSALNAVLDGDPEDLSASGIIQRLRNRADELDPQ